MNPACRYQCRCPKKMANIYRTPASLVGIGCFCSALRSMPNNIPRGAVTSHDQILCTPPILPFLVFLEKGKENHQKARIFYPYRTPKIPGFPGKEGKNAQKNKEILARRKNKEIQKNKERTGPTPPPLK